MSDELLRAILAELQGIRRDCRDGFEQHTMTIALEIRGARELPCDGYGLANVNNEDRRAPECYGTAVCRVEYEAFPEPRAVHRLCVACQDRLTTALSLDDVAYTVSDPR